MKHCEILVGEDFVFKTVRDGGSADNYNTVNEGNDWKVAFDCKDIKLLIINECKMLKFLIVNE